MKFRIIDDGADRLFAEEIGGKFAVQLFRLNRWVAFVRVLSRDDDEGAWRGIGGGNLVGEKEPFREAAELLRNAVVGDGYADVSDGESLRNATAAALRSSGALRFRMSIDDLHDAQIVKFLEHIISQEEVGRSELEERLERYRITAAAVAAGQEAPMFYASELEYDGDWVMNMAIDLVRRQCEPTSAFCILVAAEPTDSEFAFAYTRFRDRLDQISGDYVRFFAISNLTNEFSARGKRALASDLRAAGIELKDDQAFLVVIRLRKSESLSTDNFVADVMGVLSFPGRMTTDDVEPLLVEISKVARESKMKRATFEQFEPRLQTKLAWVRATQRVKPLVDLLGKLKEAMNFVRS